MNCIICGEEMTGNVCPACGFDLSTCCELYPTLQKPTHKTESLAFRRRELFAQAKKKAASENPFAGIPFDKLIAVLGDVQDAHIRGERYELLAQEPKK